jgi:ABC-type lipoprotein release transport system permease subunit
MVFKNLFRRKGRTILTLLGIAIGVAAIVALGAVAQGLRAGFSSMTQGSQADLVLSQAEALTALMSSVEESVADEIRAWPEVADLDGVLFGNAILEGSSYLFFFGHDPEGFSIAHYRIVEGRALEDAREIRGKPVILGRQAAQNMEKQVGDVLRLTGGAFRIVGIYETGNAFEDAGAVLPLEEAQALMLQPHRVSMVYVKLRDPSDADRVQTRVERRFPDLSLSTTSGFADQEMLMEALEGMAMGVSGLAVIIGGIGMTNTLFMSVFERTREIGLLRALGWRRWRVLGLILGESVTLALFGGLVGTGLGVAAVFAIGRSASWLSMLGTHFTPGLFVRAIVTVVMLGLVGGAYPAWWAGRLLPLEALHYEGGGKANVPRFLPGVARGLWRQRMRTGLTLLGISVGIAAIVALGALAEGMAYAMTEMWRASQMDLFAIEAGVDSDYSAIDERVGSRIAAWPGVEAVSGSIMTAANTDKMPMMLVFGYHPREVAIRHFRIIEGKPLTARHQVIIGKRAAEQMGVTVGDTLRLMNSSFRIVGIYETGVSFEEIGAVIGLREVQTLVGKPHQVQLYGVKLRNPAQAEAMRDDLQTAFPEIDFSLTAEAVESVSDMRVMREMVAQISFLAIFIGGVGMLNTMLMSVLERTREIGVLRALGWRRARVLGMILQESLVLGAIGGVCGILMGLGLGKLLRMVPGTYGSIDLSYEPQLFVQAVVVALIAGILGGLYPAWRAARMRPVEALRYE